MKKIFLYVLVALACSFSFATPSYMNNKYQKLADEYNRAAQNAFNSGEYDRAVEFSRLAEENAALSREYIDRMMIRGAAEEEIEIANSRLLWAKNIGAKDSYPEEYAKAENSLALALAALDSEDYVSVSIYSQEVLDALANVHESSVLPEYYVVREWTNTRDCLWNIAGLSFVYNNPWLWKELYNANKDLLVDSKNPDLVEPGTKLRIPSLSGERRAGEWVENRKYDTYKHKAR